MSCELCNRPLGTGDFNGICQECRMKGYNELAKPIPEITFVNSDLQDLAKITQKHFGVDMTCTEQYQNIEKEKKE